MTAVGANYRLAAVWGVLSPVTARGASASVNNGRSRLRALEPLSEVASTYLASRDKYCAREDKGADLVSRRILTRTY